MARRITSNTLGELRVTKTFKSLRNNVALVRSSDNQLYVYKNLAGKKLKNDPLEKELTFLNLGIKHRKRSIKEIVEFSKKMQDLSIRTPTIIEAGDNYTIEEFIPGKNILEIKEKEKFTKVVTQILNSIHKMHYYGLVAGDRWYDSQIVDQAGNVYLIDFDLAYEGKNQAELEMSEVINALTYQRDFESVVHVAETFIKETKHSYNYDLDLIVDILEKHIKYWSDPQNILASLIRILLKQKN